MRKYIPLPLKRFLKEVRLRLVVFFNRVRGVTALSLYRVDVYSQNGEDGVLYELCRRLGITGGWLVEFGAWDGMAYSNTFRLLKYMPFQAVYIEGDLGRYQDLLKTAKKYSITPIQAFVEARGEHSLDALLAKTPIPTDFEILSIDIDSFDYQVWEGCIAYKPKVVVIEVNSGVTGYQIHGEKQGSSFFSTLELGNKKGYTCVLHTGNMIFVRDDLVTLAVGRALDQKEQTALFRR